MLASASPETRERLRLAQGDEPVIGSRRFVRSQLAQARHRGDMPHGSVIAQLSVAAKRKKVGDMDQVGETVRRNTGDVPKEIEIKNALESNQACQSFVGERSVNQEPWGSGHQLRHGRVGLSFWRGLEQGKVLEGP